MTASRLDRRVQVYRARWVDDGLSKVPVWEKHGYPLWALREDVKDAERWRAGEVQASVTSRFQVRSSGFSRDIDARDRIECEGAIFEITGTKEATQYGRRQLLEWTCTRRTDGG